MAGARIRLPNPNLNMADVRREKAYAARKSRAGYLGRMTYLYSQIEQLMLDYGNVNNVKPIKDEIDEIDQAEAERKIWEEDDDYEEPQRRRSLPTHLENVIKPFPSDNFLHTTDGLETPETPRGLETSETTRKTRAAKAKTLSLGIQFPTRAPRTDHTVVKRDLSTKTKTPSLGIRFPNPIPKTDAHDVKPQNLEGKVRHLLSTLHVFI